MKNKPTVFMEKVLKEIGYRYKVIDSELCGYKKLKNHDIEISNMNNNKQKNINWNVYVWENSPRFMIVERHCGIKSIGELKQVLSDIEEKY